MIFYEGRLAPVGRPFMTRIPGEGVRRVQFNEFSLPLASRAKLWINHDKEGIGDIGQFVVVIAHRGWFIGDFTLDRRIDDETAALIKPGLGLSIGCDIVRSEVDRATGVEHVLEGHLREVSVCRTPMIPEAKIVRRWESSASTSPKPKPSPSAASDRSTAGDTTTGDEVIIHHEPVLVRREAVMSPDPEMQELWRRMDWVERRTGRPADMDVIIEGMKAELYRPSLHTLHSRRVA